MGTTQSSKNYDFFASECAMKRIVLHKSDQGAEI